MDWQTAIPEFLKTYAASTQRQYQLALDDFASWYRMTYGEEPVPDLLTAEELRHGQPAAVGGQEPGGPLRS